MPCEWDVVSLTVPSICDFSLAPLNTSPGLPWWWPLWWTGRPKVTERFKVRSSRIRLRAIQEDPLKIQPLLRLFGMVVAEPKATTWGQWNWSTICMTHQRSGRGQLVSSSRHARLCLNGQAPLLLLTMTPSQSHLPHLTTSFCHLEKTTSVIQSSKITFNATAF